MPPPRPPTSTSTENLLLKCQKETHKKCLPPEWSIYPPNQDIHPPQDTLALAIQIDSSSPSSVHFYEGDSNRSVGSIGPEYRGSIVVVPWRPGLKFVCVATCRRRSGCRVGVVREAKKGGIKAKSVHVGIHAASATSSSNVGGNHNSNPEADDTRGTTVITTNSGSSTAVIAPGSRGESNGNMRIMGNKRQGSKKHVSFEDRRSLSGKSSIETESGGPSIRRTKNDVKPR
ncbi:hypothetical protein V8C37DRAFT_395510 [Trichoderma ceciliae]